MADVKPRSTQDFVDNLIARQANIINAAIRSQTAINDANLRKRYANYPRAPKLRQRLETEFDDHSGTTEPLPVSFTVVGPQTPRPAIFAATKWIQVKNPFSGVGVGLHQTNTFGDRND